MFQKLELCYIWIDDYKLIKKEGFNFGSQYTFKYDGESKMEVTENPNYIEDLFGEHIINITAIIGKNGSGKTFLLDNISEVLFDHNTKHIVIFKIAKKLFIIHSDTIKEPIINNFNIERSYCKLSEEDKEAQNVIKNYLGTVNLIHYSNVFNNANSKANENPYQVVSDISTSSLVNKNNYCRKSATQLEKFFINDTLLMVRFLLDKKYYIDNLIKPSIHYINLEIINNYVNDKIEKNNRHSMFLSTSLFNNVNSYFKENKKAEIFEEDRDKLFIKLLKIKEIENEEELKGVKYFKISTIINVMYDFYTEIDTLHIEDEDFRNELYNIFILKKEKINEININNFDKIVKCLLVKIKGELFKLKDQQHKKIETKLSEIKLEQDRIVKILDKISTTYINKNLDSIAIEEILLLVLKDFHSNSNIQKVGFNEEACKNTIHEAVENYMVENNVASNINFDIVKNIIDYDFKIDYKVIKQEEDSINKIINDKDLELKNYIKFIDCLKRFDNIDKNINGDLGLISVKLTNNNLKFLDKFINAYYAASKRDYYNFSWSNKIDEKKRELSSGEEAMFKMYARLYNKIKEVYSVKQLDFDERRKSLVILMDEPEVYLHPEWQRELINNLIGYFKEIYNSYRVQIILTSNTPFLISDLPRENIILLNKVEIDNSDKYKIEVNNQLLEKTFGQNINTLLRKSFFINSTIGEFSKNKINELILALKPIKDSKSNNFIYPTSNQILESTKLKSIEEVDKMINLIGEPIIREKLIKMLAVCISNNSKEEYRRMLKKKIDDCQRKLEDIDKE